MMTHASHEIIRRVADATIRLFRAEYENEEPAILRWDWQPGVGLYGLLRAAEVVGDDSYRTYVKSYIDRLLDAEIVSYSINGAIMFESVLKLYAHSGSDQYRDELRFFLRWLMRSAPKCQNGCYEHSWTDVKVRLTDQVWVDTLFMVGIVLAESYRLFGREDCLDAVINQFVMHHHSLQDETSGLFRHLYDVAADSHMAGAFWGRGNGWMAVSAVEVLDACGPNNARLQPVKAAFQQQMAAVESVQAPNGMFHTILNDDSTMLEMSATAALGYAALKGVRLGVLDDRFMGVGQRAAQVTRAHIEPTGIVARVSAETSGFIAYDDYNAIPVRPRLYGQTLALLLLAEESRD